MYGVLKKILIHCLGMVDEKLKTKGVFLARIVLEQKLLATLALVLICNVLSELLKLK